MPVIPGVTANLAGERWGETPSSPDCRRRRRERERASQGRAAEEEKLTPFASLRSKVGSTESHPTAGRGDAGANFGSAPGECNCVPKNRDGVLNFLPIDGLGGCT
jgi:hypothetical protein